MGDNSHLLQDPLVLIETPSAVLPIVEGRLPKACGLYNMVLMATKLPGYGEQIKFYTVDGNLDPETSWVIAVANREDCGQEISISIPQPRASGNQCLENESKMLDAFTKTKAIDWRAQWQVCGTYGLETEFMLKLQLQVLYNPVLVFPSNVYSMDPETGKNLRLPPIPDNVQLKPLDAGAGANFLCSNWHHRRERSSEYVRRLVTYLPSCGLWCDGQLVSGIATSLNACVGLLYTSKAYRGRGYAKLVEMHLMKQLASEGYWPYATVQTLHKDSMRFHETKIPGLKLSHRSEFIFHTPEQFDD